LNGLYQQQSVSAKLVAKGEIHETLQNCKSLTKRQIQCFNNVGCHGFEFATPYRALPSFVNDPLSLYYQITATFICLIFKLSLKILRAVRVIQNL
jgi:hypothetical protein